MTKTEKMIICVMVILVIFSIAMISYSIIVIKRHGGISQVIIETGKEIVIIKKAIEK